MCTSFEIDGIIYLNDTKLLTTKQPNWTYMSANEMQEYYLCQTEKLNIFQAIPKTIGNEVTHLEISQLSGKKEAITHLFSEIMGRICSETGLQSLAFHSWQKLTQLEPEVLQVLVKKAKNLKKLEITGMDKSEDIIRSTLETNLIDFIRHASGQLEDLTIQSNEMGESRGAEICSAFMKSDIRTLKRVKIENQINWFDSE